MSNIQQVINRGETLHDIVKGLD